MYKILSNPKDVTRKSLLLYSIMTDSCSTWILFVLSFGANHRFYAVNCNNLVRCHNLFLLLCVLQASFLCVSPLQSYCGEIWTLVCTSFGMISVLNTISIKVESNPNEPCFTWRGLQMTKCWLLVSIVWYPNGCAQSHDISTYRHILICKVAFSDVLSNI